MIPIFVGCDDREIVGFHVFCHSVLARTKARVSFHPVRGDKVIGSTTFNPGRFDVARQMGFRGWGLYAECDMLCLADVEELMDYRDPYSDVVVAQHSYTTKHPKKFLGQPNPDYPHKNWSSLMWINAGAAVWPRIEEARHRIELSDLHRFAETFEGKPLFRTPGKLPLAWNHLVSEYEPNPQAKLAHFTIGLPCWPEYADCEYADAWRKERDAMLFHKAT